MNYEQNNKPKQLGFTNHCFNFSCAVPDKTLIMGIWWWRLILLSLAGILFSPKHGASQRGTYVRNDINIPFFLHSLFGLQGEADIKPNNKL